MIKMLMLGYLGKDAVVRKTETDNTVINFSCCHTESWTNAKGEKQERAVWVDCSYWTEKTGIAPYLKKGTQVYLEGIPAARHYTAGDGSVKSTLTLRVLNITLAGKANDTAGEDSDETDEVETASASTATGHSSTATSNSKTKSAAPAKSDDDDLPF